MPVQAAFLAAALALCSALGALAPAARSCWPAGPAAQPVAAQQAAAPSQAPRLRRLSLADAPGALMVMWSTGAPPAESCVQLWPVPAGPSQLAAGRPEVLRSSAAAGGQRILAMAAGAAPSAAAQVSAAATAGASSPPPEPPPGADVRTLCGSSAPFVEPSTNATSQYLHKVELTGLDPGSVHLYRVGSQQGGWSGWGPFTAPRAPEHFSEARPASLLVVGDLGYANSQTLPDLLKEAEGGGFDALLHVGDIAYDLQALQGRRASQFLDLVEPVASRLPYMVLPGNHEWHFNFSHYRNLFAMPNRAVGEGLFYSFDVGPLHVLAYNTEAFYWPQYLGLDSMRLMYEWMDRDLQGFNRTLTPWVLVAGHRPMYCVATRGGSCDWGWSLEHEASRLGIPSNCSPSHPLICPPTHAGGGVRYPIEELLHRHGVDIVVYGHSHCYERYYPVHNLTVLPGGGTTEGVYLDPGATVHVTSGAGGNAEMRRGTEPPPIGPCNSTASWCAFQSGYAPQGAQSSDYSYSRVRALNATHLLWEQYSSTLGTVVDRWWLVRHRRGPW